MPLFLHQRTGQNIANTILIELFYERIPGGNSTSSDTPSCSSRQGSDDLPPESATCPEHLTDEIKQRLPDAPRPAPAADRVIAIEAHVENERISVSNTDSFDEAWILEVAGLAYDRGYRPDGVQRQTAAVLGSGGRSPKLAELTLPTAIIHGRADRLLKYQTSIELARLIPDAELHLYRRMGHVVVAPLWEEFATIIRRTADRAD